MPHFTQPKLQTLLFIGFITLATGLSAEPFTDCPTEAFLIQNKQADLFGVQLSTGFYEEIAPSDWGQEKMNAIGFNYHDNYLYAYNYYYGSIVKIDSNYNVTPLWPSNMPNTGFYVGDIAVASNTYYLYRPGSKYGLYRIEMDEAHSDYMSLERVASGSQLSLNIYDMAFHPDNGLAYSVDRWGNLHQINVDVGSSSKLSNVGQSGVFGAVYFDVSGNLYISRNNDGHIYRIDTNSNYPVAEFFAYGPASSNNDGARCALAPIIDIEAPTTDFGRAPDSYSTSINANGARHNISEGILYLGDSVYGEPNAYADNGYNNADDDGVNFVTDLSVGELALIEVEASSSGYLQGWIDFDRDGEFDADEQIFTDQVVSAGVQTLAITLPNWADEGSTWARFRVSDETNVPFNGGVASGEVEDYPVEITSVDTVISHYPNASGWATLAFEDNWPLEGDYDMNDVVMQYRLAQYDAQGNGQNNTRKIALDGQLMAIGGSYHSGFAFRIPGLLRNQVDLDRSRFTINGVEVTEQYLEADRTEAILIIAEDFWDRVTAGENCKYYRTEPGCGSNIQFEFSLELMLEPGVQTANIAGFPYDPFIFASEGFERSYVFGEAPGRRYEVHLKNQAPTEAFQDNFFGRGDDASDASQGKYFVTENGMPWAINLPYAWTHPVEYLDVKFAYPLMHDHISSAGVQHKDWFKTEKSNINNLFNN